MLPRQTYIEALRVAYGDLLRIQNALKHGQMQWVFLALYKMFVMVEKDNSFKTLYFFLK